MQINTFSVPDLVGFAVSAALALLFHVSYWFLGRRLVELLFANALTACAAGCLVMFFEDNVVGQGKDAYARVKAAHETLRWFQVAYTIGPIAIVTHLHFALHYCGVRNAISRNIKWLYLASVLAIPVVWSPAFLEVRSPSPIAGTAGWTCAVPWLPVMRPLGALFGVLWFALTAYVAWLFLFRAGGPGTPPGSRRGIRLLRIAIMIQTLGVLADLFLGLTALWSGIAAVPLVAVPVAVLASVALGREGIDAMRERTRMEREMEIASGIQRGLLPSDAISVPGFDMAGWSLPAYKTGGDTCDLFPLPDGRWLITLADVSSHGLGPALMASEVRATLRALTKWSSQPHNMLSELRQLLALDLQEGKMITCFLAILDPASASISYASAGQGPIIRYVRSCDRLEACEATELPLLPGLETGGQGLSQGFVRLCMAPGDFLAVFSDGFFEAANAQREQFSIPRLLSVLSAHQDLAPADMIIRVRREVEAFVGPQEQADDMTAIVLRKL